ncbi:MAG TPA: MFS transporter, partial [Aggregatilineales bacterium]|nr:MFS transporter [Aggregatilineales bacterium]
FSIMLIALMCAYPASGAFVGLSQSTLMDLEPARHEHNMARWTFVGAIGVLGGSLVLSLFTALALGWRAVFVLDAGIAALLVIAMWRVDSDPAREPDEPQSLRSGLLNALHALQRSDVLRWLILLQFADLLLDVLLGYVTLYFVDVTGVTAAEAAIGVAVWMGASLLGDLVMIPLLERVQGLIWLRLSAVIELILFPAFLLVAGFLPKLILLCLVGLFSSGWYAILQSQLYSALPGQSGTVLALSQIASTIGGGLLPLIIGLAAEHVGIGLAIGIVALAPIALLIGLPRRRDSSSHVLQEASPTFEGD